MILGIGTDICNIERIEKMLDRFGERFTHRFFSVEERSRSDSRPERAASYAKRFAAKEAMAKALGTGIAEGVALQDLCVVNLPGGRPVMELKGKANALLLANVPEGHVPKVHLSISDDMPFAQAFIVIEAVIEE